MSVGDELTALRTNITSAYSTISTKGGTVPANRNTANLATAINSISSLPAKAYPFNYYTAYVSNYSTSSRAKGAIITGSGNVGSRTGSTTVNAGRWITVNLFSGRVIGDVTRESGVEFIMPLMDVTYYSLDSNYMIDGTDNRQATLSYYISADGTTKGYSVYDKATNNLIQLTANKKYLIFIERTGIFSNVSGFTGTSSVGVAVWGGVAASTEVFDEATASSTYEDMLISASTASSTASIPLALSEEAVSKISELGSSLIYRITADKFYNIATGSANLGIHKGAAVNAGDTVFSTAILSQRGAVYKGGI